MKNLRKKLSNEQYINVKKVYKKGKGQFFSFVYISDEAWEEKYMKSESRRNGHHVIKISIGSMRTGISYDNLKSTIEKRKNQEFSCRSSFYTTNDNIIGKHKNQETYYLLGSPNGKSKTYYIVDGKRMTKKELIATGLMRDSFSSNSEINWQTIKINNILGIF